RSSSLSPITGWRTRPGAAQSCPKLAACARPADITHNKECSATAAPRAIANALVGLVQECLNIEKEPIQPFHVGAGDSIMVNYPKDLDGLRWEKDAGARAGYLILDRPPMNVIAFRARAQIAAIIAAMDEDPEIRVIVIRGANGLYSSGGDIAGFLKVERDGMHDLAWNVAGPERAKKPVVAAIEKWAMGVAFELALAADFRIATENSQLALPEINLGITPGSGGTVRIAHLAGLPRAKEMIMRGRRLTAREAFDWGILS